MKDFGFDLGIRVLFFLLPVMCFAQEKDVDNSSLNNIIPKPVSFRLQTDKHVVITKKTLIVADKKFLAQAAYLKQQLQSQCGLPLSIQTAASNNASVIVLAYDNKKVRQPEMYLLDVKNNQVKIKAQDVEGIVHGIQTLLQLMPLKAAESISFPSVSIEDYPRFRYRGMHLDVSRHFFQASFIKKYLDYLAFHKFNTFHWH